jgi:hypothetical protein
MYFASTLGIGDPDEPVAFISADEETSRDLHRIDVRDSGQPFGP